MEGAGKLVAMTYLLVVVSRTHSAADGTARATGTAVALWHAVHVHMCDVRLCLRADKRTPKTCLPVWCPPADSTQHTSSLLGTVTPYRTSAAFP